MNHSPEPWKVERSDDFDDRFEIDHSSSGSVVGCDGLFREDADRIVACVNFCKELSDEVLETKSTTEVTPREKMLAQRVEWLEEGNANLLKRVEELLLAIKGGLPKPDLGKGAMPLAAKTLPTAEAHICLRCKWYRPLMSTPLCFKDPQPAFKAVNKCSGFEEQGE